MTNNFRKGQGATEYIVVLAIVLMVALVVVGLLGFFPSFSGTTQVSESNSYWQSIQPIAITNSLAWSSGANANITLVLQNQAPRSITITLINLTSTTVTGTSSWNSTSTTLAPGAQANVQFFNTTGNITAMGQTPCTSGNANVYNVTLTYNDGSLTGVTEKGAKPISIVCQ